MPWEYVPSWHVTFYYCHILIIKVDIAWFRNLFLREFPDSINLVSEIKYHKFFSGNVWWCTLAQIVFSITHAMSHFINKSWHFKMYFYANLVIWSTGGDCKCSWLFRHSFLSTQNISDCRACLLMSHFNKC